MRLRETPELQQVIQLLKDARSNYRLIAYNNEEDITESILRIKINDLIEHIENILDVFVEKR